MIRTRQVLRRKKTDQILKNIMVKVNAESLPVVVDLKHPLRRVELLIGSVGPGKKGLGSLKGFCTTALWFLSLCVHFAFDFYESIYVFGHTFVAIQAIWLGAFLVCTAASNIRSYPWLKEGLILLKGSKMYNKTLARVSKSIMVSRIVKIHYFHIFQYFFRLFASLRAKSFNRLVVQ